MLRNTIKMLAVAFLWIGTSCKEAPAQESMGRTLDTMLLPYPYIKKDLSRIENDSANKNLDAFFQKLYELKTGKRDHVIIVHIGDSHIQADFLTGRVRQNMQLEFGNAGRGTVFPYRVAKTNGPSDYRSWTNTDWVSERSAYSKTDLPTGLSGYTVETMDTASLLRITMKNMPGLDYSFNKLTLFHDKGMGSFGVTVCDTFNCELAKIDVNTGDPYVSVVNFDKMMNSIMLDFSAPDTNAKRERIYGMMLENGQPGVLYNMIGVNGAEYRHYNQSELFLKQFAQLKPDLIIVSMGTNEGYAANFKADRFYNNMDTLVSDLRKVAPDAKFLLSTPGDSFRRTRKGRVKNPDMKIARNTVVDFCTKNELAYWDLYNVMGGFGSMAKWYVSGLAAKDRIHFSKKGYDIQGRLLYDALMKDYETYVTTKYGKK